MDRHLLASYFSTVAEVSRMEEEEYLSGTVDDLFSDKNALKYASGSDTDDYDEDDYEDKNIGCRIIRRMQ